MLIALLLNMRKCNSIKRSKSLKRKLHMLLSNIKTKNWSDTKDWNLYLLTMEFKILEMTEMMFVDLRSLITCPLRVNSDTLQAILCMTWYHLSEFMCQSPFLNWKEILHFIAPNTEYIFLVLLNFEP